MPNTEEQNKSVTQVLGKNAHILSQAKGYKLPTEDTELHLRIYTNVTINIPRTSKAFCQPISNAAVAL